MAILENRPMLFLGNRFGKQETGEEEAEKEEKEVGCAVEDDEGEIELPVVAEAESSENRGNHSNKEKLKAWMKRKGQVLKKILKFEKTIPGAEPQQGPAKQKFGKMAKARFQTAWKDMSIKIKGVLHRMKAGTGAEKAQ
jgi:hypothetical protein